MQERGSCCCDRSSFGSKPPLTECITYKRTYGMEKMRDSIPLTESRFRNLLLQKNQHCKHVLQLLYKSLLSKKVGDLGWNSINVNCCSTIISRKLTFPDIKYISLSSPTLTALNDLLSWTPSLGVNDTSSWFTLIAPVKPVVESGYFPFWASTFPDFHCTFCSVKGHFQIAHQYFTVEQEIPEHTCPLIESATLFMDKAMPVTINSCISTAVSSIVFQRRTM